MDNSQNSEFKSVKLNFETIKKLKSNNLTLEATIKNSEIDGDRDDKTFCELFKIAYDNSNDENVATGKMLEFLDDAENISKGPEHQKEITAMIYFLTDLAQSKKNKFNIKQTFCIFSFSFTI
jgi:hypothetical protein